MTNETSLIVDIHDRLMELSERVAKLDEQARTNWQEHHNLFDAKNDLQGRVRKIERYLTFCAEKGILPVAIQPPDIPAEKPPQTFEEWWGGPDGLRSLPSLSLAKDICERAYKAGGGK